MMRAPSPRALCFGTLLALVRLTLFKTKQGSTTYEVTEIPEHMFQTSPTLKNEIVEPKGA